MLYPTTDLKDMTEKELLAERKRAVKGIRRLSKLAKKHTKLILKLQIDEIKDYMGYIKNTEESYQRDRDNLSMLSTDTVRSFCGPQDGLFLEVLQRKAYQLRARIDQINIIIHRKDYFMTGEAL